MYLSKLIHCFLFEFLCNSNLWNVLVEYCMNMLVNCTPRFIIGDTAASNLSRFVVISGEHRQNNSGVKLSVLMHCKLSKIVD